MRTVLLFLLLFAAPAYPLVTNYIHLANHGGWSLLVNIGADKGDKITLDVKCDHDHNGECLVDTPKLKDETTFLLKSWQLDHQAYEVTVPKIGDHFVTADYWWVGTGVHYEITIVAVKP